MAPPRRRVAARVLPVSPQRRVLLLHERNPDRPDEPYWGSIGGAVDGGEGLHRAAVRELHEETGLVAHPEHLVGPVLRVDQPFAWAGRSYVNDAHFFALPLAETVEVTFEHLEDQEVGNVLGAHWWTPEQLREDGTAASAELPQAMELAIEAIGGAR